MPLPKIDLPPLPWNGGCQCGAVRYTISEKPLTLYQCHCTECQAQSSSAFGMSMRVYASGIAIEGKPKSFIRDPGKPTEMEGLFCSSCGSRLIHRGRKRMESWSIKAGSLDDTSWLQPVGYLWTGSKQAGSILDPDLLAYEGQPESDDDLIAAWRKACGE